MSTITEKIVRGQDLGPLKLQINSDVFNLGKQILDRINALPDVVSADIAIDLALAISGIGTVAAIAELGPGPLDFGVGGFISAFAGRLSEYTIFRPIDRAFRQKFRTSVPNIRSLREGVRNGTLGLELARFALADNNLEEQYVDALLTSWTTDARILDIKARFERELADLEASRDRWELEVKPVEDDLLNVISELHGLDLELARIIRDDALAGTRAELAETNRLIVAQRTAIRQLQSAAKMVS